MTLRKIKSDSLKVLKIHHLYGIEEIDAPNLVSLDYMGNQIPELKMARESSQLEHSKITILCRSSNAAWFCHEGDKARMIDQLLDEHESELDVISIVVMPGLGKTTLANKVYNNTLVASHFNVPAWCIISQKYNKSKVLREILQQFTGSEGIESEDDFVKSYKEHYWIKELHFTSSADCSISVKLILKILVTSGHV
ncbi:hypothetical protein MTR67_040879 [Solanum verrucosum]|uniref:NB-ARC domain-containing protein n=1 Tax=Solanum verrucosum TaxID=315347 RepID=A0AAF0ZSJ5_SOLVR|nr:hypothetical protein MTR67_040879 [Solanum verrucosum]